MKIKERWTKQNNSVKLLLKKLKRHDAVVVAIAVFIALLLCGGLIYFSTPVVTASTREELVKSEKENNEKTIEKLDELSDYLTGLDRSIEDSKESISSFYDKEGENRTLETQKSTETITSTITNTVTDKVAGLGSNLNTLHETITNTQNNIDRLKEVIEKDGSDNSAERSKQFAQINSELENIKSQHTKAQSDTREIIEDLKNLLQKENADISKDMNDKNTEMAKELKEGNAGLSKELKNSSDSIKNELESKTSALSGEMLSQYKDLLAKLNDSDKKLSEQNSDTLQSFQNEINSLNQELSGILAKLNEEMDKMGQSVNDNIDKMGNSVNSGISDMGSSLSGKFDSGFTGVNDKLDANVNSLNNNIDAKFSNMHNTVNQDFSELNTYLRDELGTMKGRVEAVFQRVSNGKKLLASALLTKNQTIREGATFAEIARAIENIPSQIVLGGGEVSGEITYEYHYHKDGRGTECNEAVVSPDRRGNCYNEAVYHVHTDDCYDITYTYYVRTSASVEERGFARYENGETIRGYKCLYCGARFDNSDPGHDEFFTNREEAESRGAIRSTTEHREKKCQYEEGDLEGYKPDCGYIHGQVVTAKIVFPGMEDYNTTTGAVNTSHIATTMADRSFLLNSFIMNYDGGEGVNGAERFNAFEGISGSADEDVSDDPGDLDGQNKGASAGTAIDNKDENKDESNDLTAPDNGTSSFESNVMERNHDDTNESSAEQNDTAPEENEGTSDSDNDLS